MENKKMSVLVVEAGKRAVVAEIEDTLGALQTIVGGCIDVTCPFPDPVGIILNDEGIYNTVCLPNRYIAQEGNISGVLCGTFIVAGLDKENFRSLTKKEMEYYLHYYNEVNGPQFYIKEGEKIQRYCYESFLSENRETIFNRYFEDNKEKGLLLAAKKALFS